MSGPFDIWDQTNVPRNNRQTPRRKRVEQSPKPRKSPKSKKNYMPKKAYRGGKSIAGPNY